MDSPIDTEHVDIPEVKSEGLRPTMLEGVRERKRRYEEKLADDYRREQEFVLLMVDPSPEATSERDLYFRALINHVVEIEESFIRVVEQSGGFPFEEQQWYQKAAHEEFRADLSIINGIRRDQHLSVRASRDAEYLEQVSMLCNMMDNMRDSNRVGMVVRDLVHMSLEAALSNVVAYSSYAVLGKLFGPSALAMIAAYEGFSLVTPISGGPGIVRLFTYTLAEGVYWGNRVFNERHRQQAEHEENEMLLERGKEIARSIAVGFPVVLDFGWALIPVLNRRRREGLGGINKNLKVLINNARVISKMGEKYGFPFEEWKQGRMEQVEPPIDLQ